MKILLALLLTTLGAFSKPVIAVSNYPLAYFTQRLAGDFAEVLYEIPADSDPAFWRPTDAQVSALQKADLIILNGATYEKWVVTTSLPDDKVVDTSLAFADRFVSSGNTVTHSHGNEGEHSHGGTASTIWLDLSQAEQQATAIKDALVAAFPDHAESVSKAHRGLSKELLELHDEMKEVADSLESKTLLASHPAYEYFARAYGLKVEALLWYPEMKLDENALSELEKLQAKHPSAKTFLWDDNPTPRHIPELEKRGLKSIVINPASNKPDAETDFLQAMRKNLAALKGVGE